LKYRRYFSILLSLLISPCLVNAQATTDTTEIPRNTQKHNARLHGFSFSLLITNGIEIGKNYPDFYNDYDYSAPHIYIGPQFIAGYQFNRYVSAGLGSGPQYYQTGMTLLPLFLNVKFNLLLSKYTPFVDFSFGKTSLQNNIGTDENYKYVPGPMINTSAGVKFFASSDFGFVLSIGYCLKQTEYYNFDDPKKEWTQNNLSSIVCKFGINY
jgi:hypothetical protein